MQKSEANAWALLARDINLKDPNSDWWPVHAWSNDKALNFKLSEVGKSRQYHKRVTELGVRDALQDPTVEVFAYQEMDKKSGRPQNDKPIFSAITSLMKAQSYELTALPARKKKPSIYQFNLLSVVDTDLIRLMFSGDDITYSSIDTEHYLARYIVRKRETFSRIRFIKADTFSNALEDYSRLHSANCKWSAEEVDSFYDGLVNDWNRSKILTEDFKKRIQFSIAICLDLKYSEVGDVSVNWDEKTKEVWVGVLVEHSDIAKLNASESVNNATKKALQAIYRYEGKFTFSEDIPF